MRHTTLVTLCLGAALALSACQKSGESEVDRALQSVNAIDDNNLSDLMLTVADANEAVAYFKRTTAEFPDRVDLQRNLAKSLVRANHNTEAVAAWKKTVSMPGATSADSVDYADALIRANEWTAAEQVLDTIPPTHETFKRYKLEAMVADGNKEWKKADSFYETAVGLTTKPASTLNNWGYSKLTRGQYREAERLFGEALQYDPKLFTAKNNLVLARGAQRNYAMPIVEMNQVERAQLLHTAALAAIKQGDVAMGRSLLEDAIDTHPQHFEEAVHSLNALEGK
ncbi:lipopolysaccharide assembly protein LapB [Tropicimonas sp. IMCC6043]|uniref:tetratricopeptide repeat protein n=1 Tax=Tropicimonas sp. IMCC6043 TaxID=2510645 RepID=UPI00101DBCEA|nr:tetratricopeptide repeat protein [Tropicimonas sp. IMCC6043]RYH09454.1 tetratricopeptide repeat protein [Tropicimonas sp. IMCC6043]